MADHEPLSVAEWRKRADAVPDRGAASAVGFWSVLNAIASHADHATGANAFPGHARLAARTKRRPRAIQDDVKLAEAVGLVVAKRRPNQSTAFQLAWPVGRSPCDVAAEIARIRAETRRAKVWTGAPSAGPGPAPAGAGPGSAPGPHSGSAPGAPPGSAPAGAADLPLTSSLPPEEKRKSSLAQAEMPSKTPSKTTPDRDGWTADDVLALRPTCANGHAMRAAWNGEEGTRYSFCPEGCGETFDPRKERRAQSAAADDEQRRRVQERHRETDRERKRSTVYRYPASNDPAPIGGAVAAALAAFEESP